MKEKIDVLVVDDLPPVTKRLKGILQRDESIGDVRVAASGKEATLLAAERAPDVILMDINMETRTAGIEASRTILQADPRIKIIMLTVYEDEDLIADAFKAGVVNYILKDAAPSSVVKTVTDAYHDRSSMSPAVSKVLIDELKRTRKNEERLRYYIDSIAQLSSTEVEILKLLCAGKSRNDICESRGVEESTVKTQIRSILLKLKQKKTKGAVKLIHDLGLFDLLK
jgi:DNA-binding NarL/FixJ family response regulator